ncbi:ESPR-type extended signal peptide-containing protein [uncultured Veillonella sp.]|uniref:ESPR-type extended signal peptide-containing protein n=1 Tax=uncultured Veillonella sp. TaxID=159268 RepID=UPI0025853E78|nr:ESPR-type extended signal peptide-containing protein [uncultured Veillonella sp.]
MNHVFKVVWSKTKHCYVVVSELAGMQGKKSRSEKRSVQRSSMSSSKVSAKWLRTALAAAVLVGGIGVAQVEASYLYAGKGSVGSNEVTDTNKEAVALNPSKNGTTNDGRSVENKTGIQSVVIGTDAETARGSVAIGYETKATAERSIAIGTGALASKNPLGIFNDGNKNGGVEGAGGGQATAVGDGAIASSQATAVGNDVYALGRSSIALGNDDVATYRDAISDYDAKNYFYKLYSKIDPKGEKYGYRVEGNSLVASGARSTLDDGTQTYKNIWSPTLSQGDGSIAIGSRSIAYDAGATALGTLAFALKKGSTAIGTQTRAEGVGALAFGSKSYVFSDNSIAVGSKSQVLKTGGTAYGYRTYAGGNNSIAIGRDVYANAKMKFGTGSNRQEVFSANGLYNFNPAVSAKSILSSTTSALNTFEDIIKAGGDENGEPGLGTYATAVTKEHNGVENIVQENGQNAIVLGSRSLAQGDNGLALGRGAIERGNNSMAIGSYSMTDGDNAVALGLASRAVAKNSMALGTATATMGNSSLAIGIGAINYGSSSLVLGNTSGIGSDTAGSVVLGTNTIIGSNVNRSIAIGNGASVGSYTRGENGGVMKIDPITGKPTSKTITSVDEMEREDSMQNAMAIGSNARVYSREAVNTTSGDSGYASMNGKNAMAIGNNAQAWLENSLALGVDSRTDYTPQQLATDAWRTPDAIAVSTTSKVGVISVGSIGNERRIVNVAAGAYDTDAVNVSQLKQTYESLSRQLNSNTAQSGSHFVSTNYSAIDNGSGIVDYVKKQFMQDTYERYIKAYTDYKGYLVKEQYGGAKLTDTAKQNFNAELTKLENDLRAAGMSQEQINRLMVNTYGGGQKQYAADGTTITGVTVDKASLTDPTVAGAIDQLTKAQQQDIFNVATITGMTADELKDKLSEINYDNSQAQGKGSIAIGYSAGTTQEGGLALGYKAKVLAQDDFVAGSVALGDKSTVSDTDLEATKQAGKQYKTAISGNVSTPNGGVVSVGTTRSDDGYQPMTRRIINVAAGYNDTDAVNVAQLKSLAAQEITLQDGQNKKTTAQAIGKDGGVNFTLSGGTNGDITTVASGTTVTFGLNKAASVTNTGADKDKAVTSGAVYTAVSGAKTKVAANETDTTGILTIGKTESQDLTANSYTLGINTEKLKEVLANDFVSKKDGLTADISYTANGAAAKKVGLSAGLNFTNTDNLTASVEENGVVKYALNSDLTGVNSISSGKNSTDTKITLGSDSVTLNNKKISGLAQGTEDSDAVNLGQMNSAINTATSTITSNVKTVENKVTALEGNTIVLTGDGTSKTDVQTLGQKSGISFGIKGGADITTSASGSDVTLSLNKAVSVTNTGDDANKVVTSGAVYTAVSGAKTKVEKDTKDTTGILEVTKAEGTDLAADTYTLSVNTAKLENEMKTSLNDDFAKVDASNLSDSNVTSWRDKLNVYSKGDTYNKSETYNKTEVENLAKASKTEVVADTNQNAITVNKTTSTDGTNHDVYTIGFNGEKLAEATNISYKAGADEKSKTVSLSKGLNFQANANLTATSGDNGQITYGLKSDLTGITSISGPAGKDGTNGTKITITENGIDLGGKTISNIHDGKDESDAATVKQVNEVKTDVTKLVDNTITLTGDSNKTDAQKLSKDGGISFGIKGNEDITTTASGSDVTLSLNKAASVTNTGDDANKVVTSGAVYNAVTGAKTKVAVDPGTDGILQVEKTAGTDLAGDTYTLSVNTTKLTDALDDSFAKKDASNIKETEAGQWRTALNIYDKSEVDATTKASKTEVKAKDGQTAITVDKTTSTDGTNHDVYTVGFNGTEIAKATNLTYKANGKNEQQVALFKGLNFVNTDNVTSSVNADGEVSYALNSELKGITSISGGDNNGTKVIITNDGLDVGNKKISNLANGEADNDAVNVGQMNKKIGDEIAKISTSTSGDITKITEKVTKLENNTISFTGDSGSTEKQKLNKEGGISFGITGDNDITTTASESSVALSLNKAASVTNTGDDANKVITSSAVYDAVTGAKTKVEKDAKDTTGILEVTKKEGTDLAADTYTLSINTAKLTDVLDDSFAKKDASNLDAGDVTSWRDKLNVYSKEETYSKTEIDNKAKASKTEVKAKDGQSAITVDTSTNDTDGHTIYTVGFNGDQIATATNIKYKAGSDETSKSVSLAQGLNFQAGANLTATSGNDGQITYGLNADLTGITSISGPAGKDGTNGTKITITEKGIDLGGKTISKIADGEKDTDAATVKQVNDVKTDVTKLVNNSITFTGDSGTTDKQMLNKDGGISFGITGNTDITTTASKDGVALSLNKATSVTNTGTDKDKAVTSSAVYDAVKGAKTKIAVNPETDGILTVNKTESDDLTGNSYTLSIDTTKLETEMKTSLNDDFAKVDASNLTDDNVTSWRNKLNVYSKEETYSKTEVDSKAKASKTEVKAADGQNAITVDTSTNDTDGHTIYTVGFNGDQIATATNISYKAGTDAESKKVSLSKGLNFQAGANLTATSAADGQITYGLNSNLTGITSISGPAGKDGTNGTKITITEKGIDLGGKTISNIADGTDEKDAATVGQVDSKINTAKDGLTKTLTETITSTVNTLGNNTITLTGDGSSTTAAQSLNQEGGISFGIKGSADITTSASGSDITLSLNKAGSVTNTGDDANKVVTSSAVYNAVTGAKTKVAVNPTTGGILQVEKTAGTDLAGDTYTLSVNTTKLTDALDDSFAKKDASNIKETEAGQWRTALNIYDKSEVDAATKASKTEVKAADGQSAITVTKTQTSDGTNPDIYTVGFNGDQIATATNIKYKAGDDTTSKSVSLAQGLNFQAGANLTATSGNDGQITYGLNADLTGITSISGPAGKDGTNGTKITITEKGIDLGGKTISNIADGEKDTDAATVKQVNEVKTDVTKLVDNTITLTGDKDTVTKGQALNQKDGIKFAITGNSDITTTASESSVALSLNKAASITNTGDDANRVVTSNAVYDAVKGAKTKVAVNPTTGGILQVEKTAGTDLAGDTYTLSVNTTKLTDALDDSFAKKDASNIKETEAGQWRTALNIYDKSEVDAATKASKTEVKAKDGQSAITVDTSTNDTDGHTIYTVGFNGDQIATATNIKYKAGDDTTSKSVSLAQGLNFQADANLTAASGDNGQITYGLKSDLTGITSISGPAGKDGTNGTKITITENGIDLGGKTINNIADGIDAKDAATVGQVDSKINTAKDGITKTLTETITSTVKTLGDNTITLTGDKDTATKGQALNQKDGIKFAITGNSDITTTASESSVALSLNKAASVTNTGDDANKVVTSSAVYNAVTGAKTKVAVNPATDGILQVEKTAGTDLAADTYTLSVNTTKLTDALDGSFAKKDASNLDAGDVTSWRDKLNVYSKEETYSKTEIDNKAKASKTEVKAADGQNAITVDTSTNDTDGHTIYTVGFNGDQIATATNISYKAGTDAESKKVSLSKGLNFQAGANLTATSAADGQITYGLKSDLTGITSIIGPAGKDGTNGTKITITEKGIDLGGKTISNIADGTDEKDAATVGQVDSKITTAKDGITKTLTETITSTVKTLGDNTITLTGDGSSTTAAQSLNQEGGISFGITGNEDITTNASGSSVALSLNKATSVTNIGADKDKVVTSGAVYTAVSGAKTKVAVDPGTDGILTVNKTESDDLTGNSYTLSIDTTKLETEMKTSLNDDFAKVDASNLSDGNVTSWRDKLNVYSKDETYSKNETYNKTEVDNLAKASKTEVKADSNQKAITVTETKDTTDNHAVYTIGFKGEEVAKATNLTYKANGKNEQQVALSKGLNFVNTDNLTSSVNADGEVSYALNSELQGIMSISGGDNNGTKVTITNDGFDVGNKKISNLSNGEADNDAVNVGQMNQKISDEIAKISTSTNGDISKLTEEITKLGNNTITLTGDSGTTDKQMLNKDGGISFGITGNEDITTNASGSSVALSLNKATSVTNTGDDANKVVTSNAVYNAVTGAKTKVAVDPEDGILTVNKTESDDLTGNSYTLSIDTTKLETEMKTSLNDDFAKVDASNLTDDNVTSWRNKLNVYSKEETYSKTEVDSKASASKTEVKAADDQTAITVDKTTSTDGTNHDVYTVGFNGTEIAKATNISYKAGSDETAKTVSLSKGLNFQAGANLTATSGADGQITYGLNSDLTGITSISGPAQNDTKITLGADAVTLNNKKISGLANGTANSDAVNLGQMNSAINTAKSTMTSNVKTVENKVTALENNIITLTGDSSATDAQKLSKKGGISFGIKGNADITTSASGSDIALSLNKATSVTNTGADKDKVVTSSAVYTAVSGAKTKIAVNPETDGILQVEKTEGIGLAADTYTLSVNTTKLETEMKTSLNDDFAKVDASNLTDDNVTSWRDKLNVYSKEETYSKTEIDNKAKASKTEVKAKDGQSAITVDTSTDKTDGHTVYTVGFNGTEIAKATNISYKAGSDKTSKAVSLAQGLNFQADVNLTATSGDNGQITYGLKSDLTGITSITGPAGKDGTNGTTITITEKGIDLGGKTISNIADGEKDTDAATVKQVNDVKTDVTKLVNNSITFTGDSGTTDKQMLNKDGGISFAITGNTDITTTASKDGVALSLNKVTSVTNTGDDANKVITSGAVYNAVTGAKTKVAVDPATDGILTATTTESDDLTGNSYTLSIDTTKLENEMKTSLNDDFAKVDASNLTDDNVTSWRNKLNVYSKEETYSKTEVDSKAKASKTEVKAKDGQSAITVDTSTDKTDGHTVYTVGFNGTEIAKATNISYKAGSDKTSKAVSLAQGLNFQAEANLTATSGNDGQITYGLNADLTGITSISGPAGKDGTNGTTITITEKGIDLGGKTISNIVDGEKDTDAATVKQVNDVKTDVTKLVNNSITFTGDSGTTDKQMLNKDGGISFAITGNTDITTTASKDGVALSLNKATSVTNTSDDANRVVTSNAVYDAVKGAKTKVAVDPATNGILTATATESDDLTGNSYTLSIDTAKLENEMKTSLNDDFAKVDASNLTDDNVTSWRNKLNVYSKEETYSKTEIDNKAKASKTEVKAADGQSAITVTKTISTDGTNHDVYTVGFNGEKLAEATNISYRIGEGAQQSVSLAKGFTFKAKDSNVTVSSDEDGEIVYGLNPNLTGITSITGPAGNDGSSTTIIFTEKGIDLGGKTISNIADGTGEKDAATVGQVDNKISTAKEDITKAITEEVTKVGNNTITLTGDSGATDEQMLNKEGGISFAITGNEDIKTEASGNGVKLSLDKATSVKEGENRVVTSGAVYDYVETVKGEITKEFDTSITEKVNASKTTLTENTNGPITVAKEIKDGHDNYTIGINSDKMAESLSVAYKAGNDEASKKVTLAKGFDFRASDDNLTVTSGDNGIISYGLKADLKGITSISGPADAKGNHTTLTLTEEGLDLGGKKLTGLANGEGPTDAVTMDQFAKVTEKVSERLSEVSKRANAGTAGALAAAGIPMITNLNDGNVMIGAGVGSYGGESAVAIGVSGINTTGDISYRLSTSYDSTGKWGLSGGVGFSIGSGGEHRAALANNKVLTKRVQSLETTNQSLSDANDKLQKQLDATNQQLAETNQRLGAKNDQLQQEVAELKALVQQLLENK